MAIQLLRGQVEGGGGGQKMSVFVHAQGIKIAHGGHCVLKWVLRGHFLGIKMPKWD